MFWKKLARKTYCTKNLILNELKDLPQLVIDAPYGSKFVAILDLFVGQLKNLAAPEVTLAVGDGL